MPWVTDIEVARHLQSPELVALSTRACGDTRVAGDVEPALDLGGLKAEEVTPLEVWDPAFGDEAPDVALVHAEPAGDGGQVHEGLGFGTSSS